MLSAALPRGPLVNLALPDAPARPTSPSRRRATAAVFVASGILLAALGLWLAAAAYVHGVPSLFGIGFRPRGFASDAFLAVSLVYLLALTTQLSSRGLARDVTLVVAGTLLLALSAQLIIPLPFTPVPVTGQTFAVLIAAAALGWRRGFSSVLLYVGLGAAGLPVFADVSSSPASDGYLLGFALAALVVGWLAERGWDRRLDTSVLAMLAGEVATYLGGLSWLAHFVGWSHVLAYGLLPFLPGDAVKLAAAALLLPAAWYLTGRAHTWSEAS